MHLVAILLSALANLVTGQNTANQFADIVPAKILVQQNSISENSDLHVTCSTFGFKKQSQVYIYLCQNDIGFSNLLQKQDIHDSIFIIKSVGLHHSGNYSCVFSSKEYQLHQVAMRGNNVIQIRVIANFVPADLSVAGLSTVSEGDDVELRCSVSTSLQTLDECQFIHSYLIKNESIVQVREFSVTQMEVVFTIDGAVMRDSGHYSCVVLPSNCIQEHKITVQGNNTVLLEVEDILFLRVIISCSVITLILLLILCLCCIDKSGCSASCKPRAATQPADTAMLEKQPEQTEGEDLESQDGDSFSEEEEEQEEPRSDAAEESEADYEDFQGVYSTVPDALDYEDIDLTSAKDDPPGSPPAKSLYASSSKKKKKNKKRTPDPEQTGFHHQFNG